MGISKELGPIHELDVPGGRIRYHDTGSGAPVVFIHGLLVNSDLWRKVVPGIAAAGHRCLAPDLPLGSHSLPMPDADLTPTGVADLIAAFLERLDLEDVTLVANDTGGAITQILLARNRARIGRVIFTPSDSYEDFLPAMFTPLVLLAHIPGSMRPLTELMRIRPLQQSALGFGPLAKHGFPKQIADSYLLPSRNSGAIRKDLRRFMKSVRKRYTLEAAERFAQIDIPVLLAWATEDKVFPFASAERLEQAFPDATLWRIDDSYTFVPEDKPELLTKMIVEFTRLHATP